MIEEYHLQPAGGSLSAPGVRLDLQVKEGPYRVDFLYNEWLVIEIDGATWHSTDEAKARDKMRDNHFESLAYSVIRIPAKTVFDKPQETVRRVRESARLGQKEIALTAKKSGFDRLKETRAAFAEALDEIVEKSERESALKQAMHDPSRALWLEKLVIDSSLRLAKAEFENPNFRDELEDMFGRSTEDRSNNDHSRASKFSNPRFPDQPKLTQNLAHNQAIAASFLAISEERDKLFLTTRRTVADTPELAPLLLKHLRDFDRLDIAKRLGLEG